MRQTPAASTSHQHYDDFDAQYKGVIKLKRVYIAQRLEEDDE